MASTFETPQGLAAVIGQRRTLLAPAACIGPTRAGPGKQQCRQSRGADRTRHQVQHALNFKRTARLDVDTLVQRLGPDQGAMHWDMIKVIYCHECRSAGETIGTGSSQTIR